jgi:hypothetical protein
MRVVRDADTVRISGLWDCVVYSRLSEATANAAIAREQARPLPPGGSLEWKLYAHDRPSDLGARLRNAGFEPQPPETLVVFDLARELATVPLPSGVVVRSADDRAGLAAVTQVGMQAFGQDYSAMNDELLARVEFGTVRFLVAYFAGEPVSAARLEMPKAGEFAGLFGGGTVPGFRHRGIYRALVALRASIARERGYRYLTVDAMDTSLPILRRLGFEPLTTVVAWTWRSAA